MKILMISYRLPYPLTAGYRIRIYNEAKYLKNEGHQIDLVFLGKMEELEKYKFQLHEVFDHITCYSICWREVTFNLITKTLLQHKPLQVSLYWNKKMDTYIQKIYGQYDLIMGNSVRNAEYLLRISADKTILDLHDAISYNYLNLIKNLHGIKKWIYWFERKLLVNYECEVTQRLKNIVIISEADRCYMYKNGADISNVTIIPVAVRDDIVDKKTNVEEDECAICFLGKMSYQPNAGAVIWFAERCFPGLKEEIPNLQFYVIGIEPTKEVQALSKRNGITVTGFMDNPYEVVKRCMAMIVPIRNGAGMQNKILESMIVGTPCIISSIAEEGLNGKDGETYLVADTEQEYIEAVKKLAGEPLTRTKIAKNASEFVKQYTWTSIKNRLNEYIWKVTQVDR